MERAFDPKYASVANQASRAALSNVLGRETFDQQSESFVVITLGPNAQRELPASPYRQVSRCR
jgi:hypothetical protein